MNVYFSQIWRDSNCQRLKKYIFLFTLTCDVFSIDEINMYGIYLLQISTYSQLVLGFGICVS